MTLYRRIQALWVVAIFAAATAGVVIFRLLLAHEASVAAAYLSFALVGALVIAAGLLLQMRMIRSFSARLVAAFDRSDLPAARRGLDEFDKVFGRRKHGRVMVAVNRMVLLCEEEQFDKALALARTIDRAAVHPKMVAGYLNNVAWCLLATGDLEQAQPLAEEALAKTRDPRLRAACAGTLGAICAAKGESDRALSLLSDAIASGHGGPGMMAIRHFYRGVALDAAGRREEANAAYAMAQTASPNSAFGRKAAGRISGRATDAGRP